MQRASNASEAVCVCVRERERESERASEVREPLSVGE